MSKGREIIAELTNISSYFYSSITKVTFTCTMPRTVVEVASSTYRTNSLVLFEKTPGGKSFN